MKATYYKDAKRQTDSSLRVVQIGSAFQAQRLGNEKGTRTQSPWIDCGSRKDSYVEAFAVCGNQQKQVTA